MRAEAFHHATVGVRVPRGIDGFWQIICQLVAEQGDFTIGDIDDRSNVGRGDIQVYVYSLEKAAFLKRVANRRGGALAKRQTVFRLVKRQKDAPHVRRDGTIVPRTAQQQLWTAIRTQKTFRLLELAFTASTEDLKIKRATATRFVNRLVTAGYVTVVAKSRGPVEAVYRLKPGMSTGPKAPEARKLDAELMWDPNTKGFMGEPTIAEAVR